MDSLVARLHLHAAHNGIVEVAQSAEQRGQQQARREECLMMTCSTSLARAIAGRFAPSDHWPLATDHSRIACPAVRQAARCS
jgi:hypothetical protein